MCDTREPICILDDDPSVLRSMVQLLESDGFAAEAFSRVEDLFEYSRGRTVRLVVLDVWMPDMNGLEVQSRLRETSPATKVIVITALDDPATRMTALESGAVAFLAKPFDDEAFLSAVHRALKPAA